MTVLEIIAVMIITVIIAPAIFFWVLLGYSIRNSILAEKAKHEN